jgi:uncharacterized phiE125 gp8 family phage protein
MHTKIITPPSSYPVTLEEVKRHVRAADFEDDDVLLQFLIQACTQSAENFTGRAFIDQVFDVYYDGFTTWPLRIPRPPTISVDGVFTGNPESEFTGYLLDQASAPARLYLENGSSWPTVTGSYNTVRVRVRAGYVDESASPYEANVPDAIKAAILLHIGTLYQTRETVVIGQSISQMPMSAEYLLAPYRVHTGMA